MYGFQQQEDTDRRALSQWAVAAQCIPMHFHFTWCPHVPIPLRACISDDWCFIAAIAQAIRCPAQLHESISEYINIVNGKKPACARWCSANKLRAVMGSSYSDTAMVYIYIYSSWFPPKLQTELRQPKLGANIGLGKTRHSLRLLFRACGTSPEPTEHFFVYHWISLPNSAVYNKHDKSSNCGKGGLGHNWKLRGHAMLRGKESRAPQKQCIFCICALRRCDPFFLSLSRCSIFGHPRGRGCLHLLPWVRSARFHLGSNCIPWQLQLHLIDSSQSELSNLLFKPLLLRFLVLLRYSFSWCDNTTEAGYPGPQNLQVFKII